MKKCPHFSNAFVKFYDDGRLKIDLTGCSQPDRVKIENWLQSEEVGSVEILGDLGEPCLIIRPPDPTNGPRCPQVVCDPDLG